MNASTRWYPLTLFSWISVVASRPILKIFDCLQLKKAGRRHVPTLMKIMGIEALYRKPNTSKAHPHYRIYPYLLSVLKITRPNQVWVTDITYIALAKRYAYLTVVLDWHSRKVLSWRISNTMGTPS
jgi:putative transposase